ncbi:MAG: hypothetical protein J6J65_03885 [Opitutales bacterium]|nr:hypothetical protein [Opitutales bacterium]
MPSIEGAEPLTKIGFANASIPLLVPNTKRTSHIIGSYTLPEFVLKNLGFPIWRNENESLFYPKRSEVIK